MKTAISSAILIVVLIGILGCPLPALQPTSALAQEDSAALELSPCLRGGMRAKCGSLRVPEDRTSPDGREIELRFVVIPAMTNPAQPDPIFWLAGGPGVAATDDIVGAISLLSPLLSDRDLVFVDQRGVGGSNPLLCPMPDPEIASSPEFSLSDYARECLAALDGDPRYYTSAIAMDDVDDVRAALGYASINLYGGSYGATAAQVYLRDHEEHTRSVTLLSGSLLDIPMFELEAYNSQQALDLVLARCAADARCSAAYPDIRDEFAALLDRLEQEPADLNLHDPLTGAPIPFTRSYLSQVIHSMLLDIETSRELPRAIHEAYAGAPSSFLPYIQISPAPGVPVMPLVVMCFDDWARFTPEGVRQSSAGSYYTDSQVASAESQAVTCSLLPSAREQARNTPLAPSAVPVLVLNGEADPQDPPDNMAGASQLWSNGLEVVLPNQGHHIPVVPCLKRMIEDFVRTASVDGLDTTCLTDFPTIRFDVPR